MSYEIRRRPQVLLDLIEQALYLTEESYDYELADRFIQAAESAFEHLAEYPRSGSHREFDPPELAGMRMWPIPSFPKMLIFYLVGDSFIEVVRVLHSARDIEGIFYE